MNSNKYEKFEIPKNFIFKVEDILELKSLKCSSKIKLELLEGILSEPTKIKSAEVKLSFSVAGREILVKGRIMLNLETQCSRCLKEFSYDFSEEFFETYSINDKLIDIIDIIRQTTALANEIQYLCSEDCKGLCFLCGKNLNETQCDCKVEKTSPFLILKDKFKDKK